MMQRAIAEATSTPSRAPRRSKARPLPARADAAPRRALTRPLVLLIAILWLAAMPGAARAANCGGTVVCACGDTVTSDYTMTGNLGPCPRRPSGDTIGLQLRSGVTLDCQDHTITGPGDTLKNSFGVRLGRSSVPDSDMIVRNCNVTKFWWGVYVQNSGDVLIEDNDLYGNGWFDPTQNGTGYGLDIANSQDVIVQGNRIIGNGNEGIHLSASQLVSVIDNELRDNGREQLYLINASFNTIQNNQMEGGTQGLEMRASSNNSFSYNIWAGSPLHMLDNDNQDNTFFYDTFEGRVFVGNNSVGTRFELSSFTNPTGICLGVDTGNETYVFKGHFGACLTDVNLVSTAPVTLDRSVADPAKVPSGVKVKFPGCTADFDLDAVVDPGERAVVVAAMGSAIGDARWNPEADLDHDGRVNASDLAIFDGQVGPCAPNLIVTELSNPPATARPGTAIPVSDTVQNQSRITAGKSRTQYYLSPGTAKGTGARLLGGRAVPALGTNATSRGSLQLTVPGNMPVGTYYLLACADDTLLVDETDEANCRPTTTTMEVGRPDLTISEVTNPARAVPGVTFTAGDTVENGTEFSIGTTRTRYYLSADGTRNAGDRLLTGSRAVPALAAGGTSNGTANVVIPNGTPSGTYYFLACADDTKNTVESNDTNNCRTSPTRIEVGRPDLVVAVVNNPPANAVRGGSVTVSGTVRNPSEFDAADTFRVQYYLSSDEVKNSGDRLLTGYRTVNGLAAGASLPTTTPVTIPAATLGGNYYLLVCVDDTSQVAETNEANNCRASTAKLTVAP